MINIFISLPMLCREKKTFDDKIINNSVFYFKYDL